jgi:2-polyprenyl-3-methyl-5-hydroxy-6-metoxy-1,4-benzoquinol methylase
MKIDIEKFQQNYKQSVSELLPFFGDSELELIAKHNTAWGPGQFNVEAYLRASEIRYVQALQLFNRHGSKRPEAKIKALDVGGFMAAFPLALARSGVETTLAEKYSYYAGAFDNLVKYLRSNGVSVRDEDFSEQTLADSEQFDFVTSMAVLEHLSSSPKLMLENIKRCMKADAHLIIEVPNIAYWPKRVQLLRGDTIHPDFQALFNSETPFIGHHREYTIADLRMLAELSQLKIDELISFNYTPWINPGWKAMVLLYWPTHSFASCKEILMAILSH